MNNKFNKQYDNKIADITDGLDHTKALGILTSKEKIGQVTMATIVGYRDAVGGYYDKYWRYDTNQEPEYLMGVQAAINNGAVIENYIEIAECNRTWTR